MKIIAALLSFFVINFTVHGSGIENPENRHIVDFLMEYTTMSAAQIREALGRMNFRDIQLIQRVLEYEPSPPSSTLSLNSESEEDEISGNTPSLQQPLSDDENEKDAEYP